MKTLVSCAYNMDNCCVEQKFTDGSMIAIDTIAVVDIQCLSPAKKYKLYKSSINKSIHFVQRSLSSSTRG